MSLYPKSIMDLVFSEVSYVVLLLDYVRNGMTEKGINIRGVLDRVSRKNGRKEGVYFSSLKSRTPVEGEGA